MKGEDYQLKQYDHMRKATVDLLDTAQRKHMVHSMFEVNIAAARRKLKECWRQTGELISLQIFIMHCFAKSVAADTDMQAYRD
jgi:hypothetical protein